MRMIVDLCPQEVGWYGIVDKREDGALVIDEIFLLKQEANGGTCELAEDGFASLYEKLTEDGRENDVDKLRFWGHSHANGAVGPSGQDETQAMETLNDTQDFLIRAICNKDGKMAISYFNFEKGVAIDNVDWRCDDGVDRLAIKEELVPLIKENVKELKYTTTYVNKNNNNNNGGINYSQNNNNAVQQNLLDNRPDLVKNFNANRRNGGRRNNRTEFKIAKS